MPLLVDKLVKTPVFGCQQCGQCLLSQTSYVCPMTCPKGLRNGPCGGTVDGMCEVLPEQPCVWLKIRDRGYDEAGVHAPWDEALIGTSSLTNYFSGADKSTRIPKPFKFATEHSKPSNFAQRFGRERPVITYEITSPKTSAGLARVERTVTILEKLVDGINTTTNAGGVPSLHSLETARLVAATGVPPIVQFCGRDQNQSDFARAIEEALRDGFANILALTGDWNPATTRSRDPAHWFPMDSLQMVDTLVQAEGFVKTPFIGVASNPYTTPRIASVERFVSKLRAGADFTQTQLLTEATKFSQWLSEVRATPSGRRTKILASIPLVGKPGPYKVMRRLPGVWIDEHFHNQMESSADLEHTGYDCALALAQELIQLDVDGLHIMNFGMPMARVADFFEQIRQL